MVGGSFCLPGQMKLRNGRHQNDQQTKEDFYHHQRLRSLGKRRYISGAESCGTSKCQEKVIQEMGDPTSGIAVFLLWKQKICSLGARLLAFHWSSTVDLPVP